MFVQNTLSAHQPFSIPTCDYAWLAGAARGLEVDPVISIKCARELLELIIELDVVSVDPGQSYDFGDGIVSSAFDVLGGYVSVTGKISHTGLYFTIPAGCSQSVNRLLPMAIISPDGQVTVPVSYCDWLKSVIPLRGHILDKIVEVSH